MVIFVKNERERIFADSFHTGCDKNGFVLGAIVEPSHIHDSQVFKALYQKIKEKIGRPQTKKGFFRKYEYVYDEHYNYYICPADQILTYRTTTREGYH